MIKNFTFSDEDLLSLIKNKDQKAFDLLYDKYAAPLYGIIIKLVKNDQIANKVLLDAFVVIWKHCSAGLVESALFIYMHNVIRDVAMKAITQAIRLEKKTSTVDKYQKKLVSNLRFS